MVRLKKLLAEILLAEALPLNLAKKYTSIERNPSIQQRLDGIFTKLASLPGAKTSKRGDRVYFDVSLSGDIKFQSGSPGENSAEIEVRRVFWGTDYILKDYINGIVWDRKYNRDVRLNKVLAKLKKPELINRVNADPVRQSGRQSKGMIIVFSKHKLDIAAMSTDRGWTSCMNLLTGMYRRYVSRDIAEGSFIAYLTVASDTNLNKPTARLLIKPYVNVRDSKDVIYVAEEKIYGTAPSSFYDTVETTIQSRC